MGATPNSQPATSRPAFTLVELMVAVAIIVILLAVAVPMFNLILGNRSLEAGFNQVSSMLARARAQAVGLQQPCGVVFFPNPANGRTMLGIVGPDPGVSDGSQGYIDLVTDYELEQLQPGTNAATLYNGNAVGTSNANTGYLMWPGVILFDGYGRLVSKPYQIRFASTLGQKLMGAPMNMTTDLPAGGNPAPSSQFGLVLYDRESYANQNATPETGTPVMSANPTWLDKNGMGVLVNRYNGTLIRAETR